MEKTVTFVYDDGLIMTWREWAAVQIGNLLYTSQQNIEADKTLNVDGQQLQAWYHLPVAEDLLGTVTHVVFNISGARQTQLEKELDNAQAIR